MFKLSFNRLLGKQRDNPEEAVFQDIEGYYDIKKLMMRCIVSSEPTHVISRWTTGFRQDNLSFIYGKRT